jgi:hypothetical protein
MTNYNYGCVPCRCNKERKLLYKKLKRELGSKPDCSIWYENNMILYQYKTNRQEMFTI